MKIDATFTTPQTMPSAAELTGQLPKGEKLGKACDQFEGMLVRQILSEGLKPMLAKPPGSGAAGAGMYNYMLTDTLANGVAGKSGMGISHLLQQQLAPPAPSRQTRRPFMKLDVFDEMTQALRAELQEYGGLVELLDDQQQAILRGEPEAFVDLGTAVHEQVTLLGAHRACREKTVQYFARSCRQPETSTLAELIRHMPSSAAGMIKALVEEINALITRTQRRLRQNHLLLARCVSAAQQSVVMVGGGEMVSTYGRAGTLKHTIAADPARLAVA